MLCFKGRDGGIGAFQLQDLGGRRRSHLLWWRAMNTCGGTYELILRRAGRCYRLSVSRTCWSTTTHRKSGFTSTPSGWKPVAVECVRMSPVVHRRLSRYAVYLKL